MKRYFMNLLHNMKYFTFFYFLLLSSVFAHDPSYYCLNELKQPTQDSPQAIGSYANGCLAGGIELPKNGDGYQLMRLSRERYYVHPDMYTFIKDFAKQIKERHPFKGIVVGDTGQAAGGPMPSGHKSHQIGLDVDIWLRPAFDNLLSDKERETISATSHVTQNQTIRDSWSQDYTDFVIMAATYQNTARIFVNPAIKKQICAQTDWKKNLKALSKIRPWYGHDAHMHVRLKCPHHNKDCIDQHPPANHHGCTGNDIDWWFSEEALSPKKSNKKPKQKTFEDLPPKCRSLYEENK